MPVVTYGRKFMRAALQTTEKCRSRRQQTAGAESEDAGPSVASPDLISRVVDHFLVDFELPHKLLVRLASISHAADEPYG